MRKNGQKTNDSGIEIAAPRLSGKMPSAVPEFILGLVLTLLGVFGAQWCFLSTFSVPVLSQAVILFTLLVVLLLNAVYRLNRARFVILPLLTLAYAWVGFQLRTEFIQGFLITTNRIMTTYAAHSSYTLPIYQVTAKAAQYPLLCTIFILYTSFFISLFLSWAITRRQSFGLVFVGTVPFLAAGLPFYIMPDFRAILLLFACWTTLLLLRIPSANTKGVYKLRGAYRAANPSTAAKAGLQLLPAVLLSLALIICVFPPQSYQYSANAQAARDQLTETVNKLSFFNNGKTLAGNTDHVNLDGTGSVTFTGKTMLQVQATVSHPAYLKGFTGSVYTGKSWERLPDSDYTEIDSQLGSLHIQNMSSQVLSLTHMQANDLGGYGIHVKNVAANKRLIYAPYNLTTTPEQITGVKFIHDGDIRSDWVFGTNEYTLYANSFNGSHMASNVPGVVTALYQTATPQNAKALQKEVRSYTQNYPPARTFSDATRVFYTGMKPMEIPQSFDPARKNLLTAEQAYRFFLYDKYTQLPDKERKEIQEWMGSWNIPYLRKADARQILSATASDSITSIIVQDVKNCLTCNYQYTLSPGSVPSGKDFTEYFLFENKKGYCVHFATAAVVMLRAAGVPARYAEGYIVTQDDYKNAVDGWANIPDSHAHAWVEVYYPGLGWQPVEMTPGFNVEENRTQGTATQNSASSTPAESKPQSSASSAPESKPESDPKRLASRPATPVNAAAVDDTAAVLIPIFIAAVFVMLTVTAAVIRRRLARHFRQKRFTQPNRNQAAIEIYRYLQKLTRFGGEISEPVTELAQKARFSRHTLTPDELETMLESAKQLADSNLHKSSFIQKTLIKYWYGLF